MDSLFSENETCYIIAEAGLNHNGSIDIAKRLIDVAAVAGADAVKFQKRSVDKLAVKAVLDAEDNRFPEFGKTYREIREHLEFDYDQYIELKNYSKARGLDFIVTAFDKESVDFLDKVGVKMLKVASHSLTNYDMLEYIAGCRKPTILSTGMAELDEIDQAVQSFTSVNAPLALMHCVSAYPTPLEECNLKMINVLKERYGLITGYSGHELGYLPSVVAVAMGAQMIERHFTLNKSMVGFDHRISLEPDELIGMIRDIRSIPEIQGTGHKEVSNTEWITRKKYHVSMASACEIPAGTILAERHVAYRNPGTGIPRKYAYTVMGRKALETISENVLLSAEMFE